MGAILCERETKGKREGDGAEKGKAPTFRQEKVWSIKTGKKGNDKGEDGRGLRVVGFLAGGKRRKRDGVKKVLNSEKVGQPKMGS